MSQLSDLLRRITSRKFLLSVAGFATLLANHQPVAAGGVAGLYVIIEGIVDAVLGTPPTAPPAPPAA